MEKNQMTIVYIATLILSLTFYSCSKKEESYNEKIKSGKHLLKTYQFNKAQLLFEELIEANNKDSLAYYYKAESIRLSVFFSKYNELTESEEDKLLISSKRNYENSLSLNSKSWQSLVGISKMYKFKKNYPLALHFLDEAQKIAGNEKEIIQEKRDIHIKISNYSEADKLYSSLEKNSHNREIIKEKWTDISLKYLFKFENKKLSIHSRINWVISNSNIFHEKVIDIKLAKTIIDDFYFGELSYYINLPNNINFKSFDEITTNEIISKCNNRLKKFGIKLTSIKIDIKEL